MNIIQQTFGSLQFSRGIRSLKLQVSHLELEVNRTSYRNPVIETKVRLYELSLELLLRSSQENRFISQNDHKIANLVLNKLRKIEQIIKEKRSWWERLISLIKKAISFLKNLLDNLIGVIKQIPPVANTVRELILQIFYTADSVTYTLQSVQLLLPIS